MPEGRIRALVVDDEALARSRVRRLLEGVDDVEIVDEAADGEEALNAIMREKPDLVFLDVQMPGVSGIEVLRALDAEERPEVILVTAFDRYAIDAFEAEAMDYVLKPVEEERLHRALDRARRRLAERRAAHADDLLDRLGARLGGNGPYPERFAVRSGHRIHFVPTERIDWVEADGNYVRLHAGGREHLLRRSMTQMEASLDPARFARIHRSTIVNLSRITSVEPWFHGEFVVNLSTGDQVRSSRSYTERMRELLGIGGG